MTECSLIAANDNGGDLLAHIDPRSVTFYTDAAAVAAYLVRGEGRCQDFSRCLTRAALMYLCLAAASDNRVCTVEEIRNALADASRQILHHKDNETFFVSTTHGVANIEVEVSADV